MKKNNSWIYKSQISIVFVLTTGVVFFSNVFMYYNINKSIANIDEVYLSNLGLNELMNSLDVAMSMFMNT